MEVVFWNYILILFFSFSNSRFDLISMMSYSILQYIFFSILMEQAVNMAQKQQRKTDIDIRVISMLNDLLTN